MNLNNIHKGKVQLKHGFKKYIEVSLYGLLLYI